MSVFEGFSAGVKQLPSRAARKRKVEFEEKKKPETKPKHDQQSDTDRGLLKKIMTRWKFSDIPDPANYQNDIDGPYLLATNVTPEEFQKFAGLYDSAVHMGMPKLKIEYDNGDVHGWTYTDPGHGSAIAEMCGQFRQFNITNGRRWYASTNQTVQVAAGVGGARWLLPDGQLNITDRIVPVGVLPNQPVVVVEIGSSETAPHLMRKVKKYFTAQTNVRVVICIKIFSTHAAGTKPMLAMVFLRPNPLLAIGTDIPTSQSISFGTRPLVAASAAAVAGWGAAITGVTAAAAPAAYWTGAGLAAYQITIPAATLTTNAPGPAGGVVFPVVNNLVIDLFEVQQSILSARG